MNFTTIDTLDFAVDWFATCPRCGTKYGPEEVPCFNCGGRVRFFRERHSCRNGEVKWTECGFECSKCGIKYKNLQCSNHDQEVILTIPCVKARLRPGSRVLKWVAGIATFFVSMGAMVDFLQGTRMNEDTAMALTFAVSIAATVAVVMVVNAKRWLSYER